MSRFKIKRNKISKPIRDALPSADLPRISSALRRLATAASDHLGSDCYIHAAIAQIILERLGVKSTLVAGYAAWRVGDGDGDVILHAPVPDLPQQPGAAAYHCWLELNGDILDFTTYQLRNKAASLDKLDGGKTTVVWCPDYLFALKSDVSPIRNVIQLHAGLFFYAQNITVEKLVLAAAAVPVDATDVNNVWLLFQNPDLQVFGPNNLRDGGSDDHN